MLSVVKIVILSAGNAEEIAISSRIFFVNVFHCRHIYMPSAVAGSNCGHIYMPTAPRGKQK